ncbi:unnamed protein product [Vitrella brassicaformis CCMP3155]|uniref:Uncharacterized protein n=2 Tax=Vitrella brassicaformis TaxID=1169539 RepID=A0A0G4EFS4_VITBC|nr:unnamed protein product [Vitrella brassicaformis CCMP3155]|eukprot:CEL94230.1 unnamed protein product [Vitrella brassicaformis CCMP3155]
MMRVIGVLVIVALAGVAHCQLLASRQGGKCDPTDLACAPLKPGTIPAGAERAIRNCDGDECTTAAHLPASIPNPRVGGLHVDRCGMNHMRRCGEDAADEYCRTYEHGTAAADWDTNWDCDDSQGNERRMIRIMDNTICDPGAYWGLQDCDCFSRIDCV